MLLDKPLVEKPFIDGQSVNPSVFQKGWTLDELLSGVHCDNIHSEIDSGNAIGNECFTKT